MSHFFHGYFFANQGVIHENQKSKSLPLKFLFTGTNEYKLLINGTALGATGTGNTLYKYEMDAAILNGKGAYISDMAVWDLPLHNHQINRIMTSGEIITKFFFQRGKPRRGKVTKFLLLSGT